MKKIFTKLKQIFLLTYPYLIILGVLFFYTFTFFQEYVSTDIINGWDGAQHYAVNKIYSEKIFPNPFGIINEWYAGMPWPNFYPPLFTYSMALLDRLLPFNYFEIFKYLFVVLVILFPILIYRFTSRLEMNKVERILSGIFSVFFLISSGDQAGTLGIAMGGTFENGLYPQFFAFFFFLLWIYFFFNIHKSKRDLVLSTLLFSLVLISNVHVVQPALIVFVISAVINSRFLKDKKILIKYFFSLILSFLPALFWYISLIKYNDYFLTQAIGNVPLNVALISLSFPIIFGSVSGILAIKKGESNSFIVFLSAILILILTVIPFADILPSIPLQPFRIFPVAYLFLMILAPKGIFQVLSLLKFSDKTKPFAFAIILIPLLIFYPPVNQSIAGIYSLKNEEKEMIKYVSELRSGRSMVETYRDKVEHKYLPKAEQPTHFIITGLIGAEGKNETIWGVFRESSILSPFAQPLRNSFSIFHESYGVTCWLCTDNSNLGGFRANEYYSQPIEDHINRAKLMGVKYILIRTDLMKQRIETSKEVKLLKSFGDWKVYEILGENILSDYSLEKEPILTFAKLTPKIRYAQGDQAYDWLRLNEEWVFHNRFSIPLVKSNVVNIDKEDLTPFKSIFITDYTYTNFEKAVNSLVKFGEIGQIYLLESNDKLFNELKLLKNATVIKKTGDVRIDMKNFLDIVDNKSINAEKGKWLYSKYTYFPDQKKYEGKKVYMTSPVFTIYLTTY